MKIDVEAEIRKRVMLLEFGAWLRSDITRRGMSGNKLASMLGFSNTLVANVLRGDAEPSDEFIEKTAEALKLNADELYRRINKVPKRLRDALDESEDIQDAVEILLALTDRERKKALSFLKELHPSKED